MKPNLRTALLLAVAGAAAFAQPARAANPPYTVGDLLIGFDQAGTTTVVVADIGPATKYIPTSLNSSLASSYGLSTPGTATPGATFTVQFGVIPSTSTPVTSIGTDLTNTFGPNWADNNQENLVQWGIAGGTKHLNPAPGTFGLPLNTLFLTQAETTPGVQSTPPTLLTNATASTADANFVNASQGTTSGFKNSTATANSTEVVTQNTSASNNWLDPNSAGSPSTSAFGTGLNIQQALSGANIGPTNSVLDLYLLPPGGLNGGGNATYLGYFTLDSSGDLSYTAVPEPSTNAMLVIGTFGVFAFVRRLRRLHRNVRAIA